MNIYMAAPTAYVINNIFLCLSIFGFFFKIGMKNACIANPCERAAASSGKCLSNVTNYLGPDGAVAHI